MESGQIDPFSLVPGGVFAQNEIFDDNFFKQHQVLQANIYDPAVHLQDFHDLFNQRL